MHHHMMIENKGTMFGDFIRHWSNRLWYLGRERRSNWDRRIEFQEEAQKEREAIYLATHKRLHDTLISIKSSIDPIEDLTQTVRLDGTKRR